MLQTAGTVLSGSNNIFEVETSDDNENKVIRVCSLKSKRLKNEKKYYNYATEEWVRPAPRFFFLWHID